jgi:hypothetical protein
VRDLKSALLVNGECAMEQVSASRDSYEPAHSAPPAGKLERHAARLIPRAKFKQGDPVSRDNEAKRSGAELERETGFEPATSTLARSRSTK